MPQDYNTTLNLPKTDFSMRASLPQREPTMLEQWEKDRLYYNMVAKNEGKPLYVLHDGPPYANGDIHMGTALNKVLKDIIVRSKNMTGYKSPYVPGWDTHGLPIELKAIKKLGVESITSKVELRKHCREFALYYIENQKNQFKRLGVLGDFDNPYLTLKPEFEARQIEVFGEMAKKGYIYKGLKPVYWCPDCTTALAEAEIEYAEDPCSSIYVKFRILDDKGLLTAAGADLAHTYVVIWTTTTWTLPGNMAICLGPDYEYVLVQAGQEYYIMAKELMESTLKAAKIEDYKVVASFTGSDLELMTYAHPFIDRVGKIIVGSHVTLESGTGCVHTAPGHGVEDFEVCVQHYPDIEVVVPVDSNGRMTALAGQFQGLTTDEANVAILNHLKETGYLFATEKIIHQYPHCWRCKEPVLFRATEQWFCSVEDFKDDTIKAIKDVEWIPGWGEDRITGMVRDRSDWCISRQRTWGVPIPIFFCKDCHETIITDESIKAVSDLFRAEGSDAWFIKDANEILPAGTKCPKCGCTSFTKETDIMDVWFDSGCSHASVLEEYDELHWPAELYLEGADQFRGWFQSSLLTSVAWRGVAPYKAVCSHGWVVDGEGRKMSKSLGNGILAEEIISEYGADILRLWVCSSDYHADIRISKDILKQLSEGYRKIRNTARYILGNLYDFDPNKDMVAESDLFEIDRWALAKLDELVAKARDAYAKFDFHIVTHAILNFCTVDMSNFYLDVLKDRLYVEKSDSLARRAAQTTIYTILRDLDLMLAPILAFTAEEIWQYLPHQDGYDPAAVVYNDIPEVRGDLAQPTFMQKWERIHALRDDVNKALELARGAKTIGKSLEAKVTLHCEGELYDFVSSILPDLTAIFIVSQVELVKGTAGQVAGEVPNLTITVDRAAGEKCERCWVYSDTVGQHHTHTALCSRCAEVIETL